MWMCLWRMGWVGGWRWGNSSYSYDASQTPTLFLNLDAFIWSFTNPDIVFKFRFHPSKYPNKLMQSLLPYPLLERKFVSFEDERCTVSVYASRGSIVCLSIIRIKVYVIVLIINKNNRMGIDRSEGKSIRRQGWKRKTVILSNRLLNKYTWINFVHNLVF